LFTDALESKVRMSDPTVVREASPAFLLPRHRNRIHHFIDHRRGFQRNPARQTAASLDHLEKPEIILALDDRLLHKSVWINVAAPRSFDKPKLKQTIFPESWHGTSEMTRMKCISVVVVRFFIDLSKKFACGNLQEKFPQGNFKWETSLSNWSEFHRGLVQPLD
jgi:hypothetical protein